MTIYCRPTLTSLFFLIGAVAAGGCASNSASRQTLLWPSARLNESLPAPDVGLSDELERAVVLGAPMVGEVVLVEAVVPADRSPALRGYSQQVTSAEFSEPADVGDQDVAYETVPVDQEYQCVGDECSGMGGLAARMQFHRAENQALKAWEQEHKQDPKHPRDIGYSNPRIGRELRMRSHPLYVVEPPDVLYIEALQLLPSRPVMGERLIRQDGTISLGYYGQVHVAGLTLQEVEQKLRDRLSDYVQNPQVYVDVAAFNSKVYYVLGQVQQAGRLPITGKETVLDAITLAGGVTNFAALRKIHVARPNPGGGCDQVLHVNYKAIVECGDTRTNYQLLPGDRVVIPGTRGFKASVFLDNFLTPFERIVSLATLFRFATD